MVDIATNLHSVRSRILAACSRSGRCPGLVTLVAVTKTVTPAEVAELYRLGVRDFGENRVGDALERMSALNASDARWHMIGHLQRNKAATAVTAGLNPVHSVESDKLVPTLDRECARTGRRIGVMLEVNVSGETSKYGVTPEGSLALARLAAAAKNIDLMGLMTMAPFTDDPQTVRPVFRGLAELKKRIEDELGQELPHLSMGMTNDFEVAVEEGATMVRVGTALFR